MVENKSKISGNHSGLTLPEIQRKTGITHKEIKTILNQLFIERKIRVRDGAHGKLIFKYDL